MKKAFNVAEELLNEFWLLIPELDDAELEMIAAQLNSMATTLDGIIDEAEIDEVHDVGRRRSRRRENQRRMDQMVLRQYRQQHGY